jgi:hypothetical protein
LLSYANALGLVLTDLQPLSGQGLGTGAQTVVLEEKAQGRGQAARRKDLTHQLNIKFVPPSVTTFFTEVDLRDDKSRADNAQVRANTRKTQIDSGEITAIEARQMAADAEDIPEEFLDTDITPAVSISDEDQPEKNPNAGSEITDNSDEQPEQTEESNPITAKELDAGYALYRAMRQKVIARESLSTTSKHGDHDQSTHGHGGGVASLLGTADPERFTEQRVKPSLTKKLSGAR